MILAKMSGNGHLITLRTTEKIVTVFELMVAPRAFESLIAIAVWS